MDKILILIILIISSIANSKDLNNIVIKKKSNVTKLIPEIYGLDYDNGLFGTSFALSDNYMVISAPLASNSGGISIYIKVNDQWDLLQMFDTAPHNGINHFGSSVDIYQDTILVGAKNTSKSIEDAGAVLVYKLQKGLWKYSQTIHSPNPKIDGQFGSKVMLKNNLAIIAEYSSSNNIPGLFYFYTISGDEWTLLNDSQNMEIGFGFPNFDYDGNHLAITRINSTGNGSFIKVYEIENNLFVNDHTINSPRPSTTFGQSISIHDNRMIVGDYDYNYGNGIVYYFQKINGYWQLNDTLIGPEAGEDKNFGASVSLHGNNLLIGSYGDDETAGSAGAVYYYQFNNNQWIQNQKLMASEGEARDYFGIKTEIKNNEIIVNSIYADSGNFNSGKVYSFKLNNNSWIENQIIKPLDAAFETYFSNGLALNDYWVAVGADGDIDKGDNSGAVYLYNKINNTLTLSNKIYSINAKSDQQFGKSIVIQEDKMLIGAPGNGITQGYVHFYQLNKNNWIHQSTFHPEFSSSTDYFGFAMSLYDNSLAVTAINQANNNHLGSVYIFYLENDEWVEKQRIMPTSDIKITNFGFDLSLTHERLGVGTLYSGQAFLFQFSNDNWIQTHEITETDLKYPFFFGNTVNIFNDQIIVGTDGSPFIYEINGANISPANVLDVTIPDSNGLKSFDVNNDLLAITGSYSGSSNMSKTNVYQFIEDSWQFIYELPQTIVGSYYVNDVTLFKNELLVGNKYNNQRGYNNGAANWIQNVGDLVFAHSFE